LFDTLIPTAWSYVLQTIAENKFITDVFQAWPSMDAGDIAQWKHMTSNLLKATKNFNIWPVFMPRRDRLLSLLQPQVVLATDDEEPSYEKLRDIVVARRGGDNNLFECLSSTGVRLAIVPDYLLRHLDDDVVHLTPSSVHSALMVRTLTLSDQSYLTCHPAAPPPTGKS
jgi:hypothetical protein